MKLQFSSRYKNPIKKSDTGEGEAGLWWRLNLVLLYSCLNAESHCSLTPVAVNFNGFNHHSWLVLETVCGSILNSNWFSAALRRASSAEENAWQDENRIDGQKTTSTLKLTQKLKAALWKHNYSGMSFCLVACGNTMSLCYSFTGCPDVVQLFVHLCSRSHSNKD